jgi:hypothetical protein
MSGLFPIADCGYAFSYGLDRLRQFDEMLRMTIWI